MHQVKKIFYLGSFIFAMNFGSPAWAAMEENTKALCTQDVKKLTSKATSALKSGDPDKAFEMLYECGASLTDPDALAVKAKARASANEKAAKNDQLSTQQERLKKKKLGVSIGMAQEEVIGSSWGKPRKINRTITSHSTREQWVYDGGYLYFENGILTSIQN